MHLLIASHNEVPYNAETEHKIGGATPMGTGGGASLCCDSLDEHCDQPDTLADVSFHLDLNTQGDRLAENTEY